MKSIADVKRLGTELRIRAPNQHARIAEVRQAMLRHVMHMIEEAEHKTVAHDAYMAYSGKYLPRFIGVFHGSWHVLGLGFWAMCVALKKDKIMYRPKTLFQIAKEMASMCVEVGPFMLRLSLIHI